jgi:valyl-tRNA synthetase
MQQQMSSMRLQIASSFMPFLTEEIWHQVKPREKGEDCMIALVAPEVGNVNEPLIEIFQHLLAVKTSVLELRNQYQLSPKK